jgi:hypothetical protein
MLTPVPIPVVAKGPAMSDLTPKSSEEEYTREELVLTDLMH